MAWLARRRLLAAVAAALVLATAGVAVQGRQPSAPGREPAGSAPPSGAAVPNLPANQALAREQLVMIDQALDTLHRMAQNARISPAEPSFSLWERRRYETLRRAGAGKDEIVAALEKYITILKGDEAIAQTNHESARGTLAEVLDVRYRRKEAEIWLNEEKAR
jgi:hypothetical protein